MNELKNGMVLYHGSYFVVENLDLEGCAMYKDFGRGFYLTTSKEQAKSFAKISTTKAKLKGLISYSENFAYISFFKVCASDPARLQMIIPTQLSLHIWIMFLVQWEVNRLIKCV